MYKKIGILALAFGFSWVLVLVLGLPHSMNKAIAAKTTVTMFQLTPEGTGEAMGTVSISDTEHGLMLTPQLANLEPGAHGFHVHENPSCQPGMKDGKLTPGLAAGGHYDPTGSGDHEGPYGDTHLGDLPVLVVEENGTATLPILAPRIAVADLQGHALIIHAGGDNYSDRPKPLGGGGARVACGVV